MIKGIMIMIMIIVIMFPTRVWPGINKFHFISSVYHYITYSQTLTYIGIIKKSLLKFSVYLRRTVGEIRSAVTSFH